MHFDTAESLAAFEPPIFIHEGRRYVGQLLSINEWLKYQGLVAAAGAGALNIFRLLALYRQLADAWFPPPPRRWWLVGKRAEPRVRDLITKLPLAVQTKAIGTFLHSQAAALGLPDPPPGSTLRTTSTPSSIPQSPPTPTTMTPTPGSP